MNPYLYFALWGGFVLLLVRFLVVLTDIAKSLRVLSKRWN